jgi:hypothetical protein
MTETSKEVLVPQPHHVLHNLKMLGNYRFNLSNGLKLAGVVLEEKFKFIHLRRHGFDCGVKRT